jgi:RIO kinase 1
MSFRKRVDQRLDGKEKAYEVNQLMKEKRSEDLQAWEQVFDKSTLMVIYDFLNTGVIDEIHGVVKEGKEARIYWGKDKKGNELAVKIYLTITSEFHKGMMPYIEHDPRFKRLKHDTRSLMFAWAQKEFKNLELAAWAKVRVPRPIVVKNNVLVMEFIGKNGVAAPSLKEKQPKNPAKSYDAIMTYLQRLYCKAGLVHGDLSEYNIMTLKGRPVLFDMAQAVLLAHPMADTLLRRDLTNLNRYFSRLEVEVPPIEETCRRVTKVA